MNIIRYKSPFGLMSSIKQEMEKVFDSLSGEYRNEEQSLEAQWKPGVDIKEEANRFVIQADIPGMDAKDIKISLDNNVLSIKGNRVLGTEKHTENYHRIERYAGCFHRQFTLPSNINGNEITATSKKGVLEISIPKKEVDNVRYIEVKAEE